MLGSSKILLVAKFIIYSAALTDRSRDNINFYHVLVRKNKEKKEHTSIPTTLHNIRLFLVYERATMHIRCNSISVI